MKAVYDNIIDHKITENAEFEFDEKVILEKQLIYTGMAAKKDKNEGYYNGLKCEALEKLISLSRQDKKAKHHRTRLGRILFHPFTKLREALLTKYKSSRRYKRKSHLYRYVILYKVSDTSMMRRDYPKTERDFKRKYDIFTDNYKDKIVCLTQGLEVSDEGLKNHLL